MRRREPIEQIWREKLTVTTKESANSLKQPFRLLSFQSEVKLSPSPELDFLTPAFSFFRRFELLIFKLLLRNFFESHSFSLYVVNGLLNVGRKRLQMEQLENTLRTHVMTCDNSTVSITLKTGMAIDKM